MLRALAAESGDTVFFTVLHGHESICLSRDEGDFPIRNQLIKPGDRWPLGVGAGSCAILAALPDDTVADVLARNAALRAEKFPRCTDAAVLALVRDTRERGYCLQPGMVFEDSWADRRGRLRRQRGARGLDQHRGAALAPGPGAQRDAGQPADAGEQGADGADAPAGLSAGRVAAASAATRDLRRTGCRVLGNAVGR